LLCIVEIDSVDLRGDDQLLVEKQSLYDFQESLALILNWYD
jgi:hypothetical protein